MPITQKHLEKLSRTQLYQLHFQLERAVDSAETVTDIAAQMIDLAEVRTYMAALSAKMPLLDIAKMSPGDAAHALQVLAFLKRHKDQLEQIAISDAPQVSIDEAFPALYLKYTELVSTRLVPIQIRAFTREDSLEHGELAVGEDEGPDMIISNAQNAHYSYVPGFTSPPSRFEELCQTFGISSSERTWIATVDETRISK